MNSPQDLVVDYLADNEEGKKNDITWFLNDVMQREAVELAGTDAQAILEKSRIMPDKKTDWKNPYGDDYAEWRMGDNSLRLGFKVYS